MLYIGVIRRNVINIIYVFVNSDSRLIILVLFLFPLNQKNISYDLRAFEYLPKT